MELLHVSNTNGDFMMKRIINITDCEEDIVRYSGTADMKQFLDGFGCTGFEYMPVNDLTAVSVPKELITGLHMRSFPNWMDLWRGDEAALLAEFDNWETVRQVFGGTDRQALLDYFTRDLELAEKAGAKYVVFHVSEVTIQESFTYRFHYRDEEVVDAAAELINGLLDGKDYHFDFLMENLWWPGFRFTDPAITARLLEQVHYPQKGIMLDTGHLFHTNLDITDQEEGLRYVEEMLDRHGDLCRWIKGVHLQQSVTGALVKEMLQQEVEWAPRYYERWCQVFSYIFKIDTHEPFTAPGVPALIERINPQYLTYELISRSRAEHQQLLTEQVRVMNTLQL